MHWDAIKHLRLGPSGAEWGRGGRGCACIGMQLCSLCLLGPSGAEWGRVGRSRAGWGWVGLGRGWACVGVPSAE